VVGEDTQYHDKHECVIPATIVPNKRKEKRQEERRVEKDKMNKGIRRKGGRKEMRTKEWDEQKDKKKIKEEVNKKNRIRGRGW
jgi:hypothetical protein